LAGLAGACAEQQVDTGRVAVHLGNGDGTFREGADVAVATPPRSLVLRDLDLDGHLDLVTVGYGGHLSIALGRGDGSFEPARRVPVASSARTLVVDDFNRDGLPDVATAGDQIVEVCLALEAGELGACVSYPGAMTGSITAADLDGDGHTDLAIVGYLERLVRILPGRGDGTFASPIDLPTGQGPYSLSVGDLDRDGRLDLVTANLRDFGPPEDTQTVSVLLATERGGFAPYVDYEAGALPAFVHIATLDDEHADLIVSTLFGGVRVIAGNGDGTFSAPVQQTPGADRPWAIAMNDFDANGTQDLAVTSYMNHRVDILLGAGAGRFERAAQSISAENAFAVDSGDVNADGIPDLVIADTGPHRGIF
jgi:hypothetical protein